MIVFDSIGILHFTICAKDIKKKLAKYQRRTIFAKKLHLCNAKERQKHYLENK